MLLRPFVSLGGYPAKMISDNGTQLTAANEEPKKVASFWDWDELTAFGATKGMEWKFLLADVPWQNGTSKALVKSVSCRQYSLRKRTWLTKGQLVGIQRHPKTYLCPNDLLFGRSTSRVPIWQPNHRFEFVQQIVDAFWRKWHTKKCNVRVGSRVLIQDSNQVRVNWKLGKGLSWIWCQSKESGCEIKEPHTRRTSRQVPRQKRLHRAESSAQTSPVFVAVVNAKEISTEQ